MIPDERHRPQRVPGPEIERRLGGLQTALREADVALAWIDHLADRLYFAGSIQSGVVLVPANGEAAFRVRKSRGRAEFESPLAVTAHPGRDALIDEVVTRAGPGARIGMALDVTPASTFLRVQERLPGVGVVDLSDTIRRLRAVKSEWELDQLRVAAEQIVTLLSGIGSRIRPGMTELELTGIIEGRLREAGHAGTVRVRRPGADVTMSTVVSGASALYPTAFDGPVGAAGPSPAGAAGGGFRRLAAGETVMLDIVTSHNGYHVDTARTFFVGSEPSPAVRAAHAFCRRVLEAIVSRLRPGAVCSEIFREVSAEIAAGGNEPPGFMGYGENRVRFFGHGVGLELDELPILAARADITLGQGMVLAVEPKAFLEESGAVGLENTYVITADGCVSLCPCEEGLVLVGRE